MEKAEGSVWEGPETRLGTVLSCGQQTQVAHGQGRIESRIQTVLRCLSQSWGLKELGLEAAGR